MLSTSSSANSRSVYTVTTGTTSNVTMTTSNSVLNYKSVTPGGIPTAVHIAEIDKTEINEAVTKVLEGYDWTLVPIATKSITHDTIPEECSKMVKQQSTSSNSSERRAMLPRPTLLRCTPRPPVRRQQTMGVALLSSSSDSSMDDDEDLLMKAGF